MSKIEVEYTDVNGFPCIADVPAHWVICGRCGGEGTSSAHLGAITADEWDNDWSDDMREAYFDGVYDRDCTKCQGSGKILEPNRDLCVLPDQVAALKAIDDEQRELADERRTMAFESGDYSMQY